MNITLFRDLPTEGWPSMERYADALGAGLQALGCAATSFVARRPWPHLRGRAGTLANYAWRSLVYPLVAPRHQGDVNHIIDHSYAHLVGALDARRTLVTCHDIAPLALSQAGRGVAQRLWARSFREMLQAAHIITDSSFTRDELLEHSDYPPERVTTVLLGVDTSFSRPLDRAEVTVTRRSVAPDARPVILHVGSCLPRKNIEGLLQALAELDDLDPVWVQVGGRFSAAQRQLIDRLGLARRVVQFSSVSDLELHAWYQAATVFAFPSWYEGFGLPVAEAMASGTPVVCARAGSLPEVAGAAAILADPADTEGLAEGLRSVITDPALRGALATLGRVRAHELTWENTARQVLAVYSQVVERVGE